MVRSVTQNDVDLIKSVILDIGFSQFSSQVLVQRGALEGRLGCIDGYHRVTAMQQLKFEYPKDSRFQFLPVTILRELKQDEIQLIASDAKRIATVNVKDSYHR